MFEFITLILLQVATLTGTPIDTIGGSGWGGDKTSTSANKTIGGSGWGGDKAATTNAIGGSGWGGD